MKTLNIAAAQPEMPALPPGLLQSLVRRQPGATQPYHGPRFPKRPWKAACNRKFRRARLGEERNASRATFDYDARVTPDARFKASDGRNYMRMLNGQIIRA